MQIQAALSWAQQELKKFSDTAQLDAEILLGYVLGFTRTQLYINNNQLMTAETQAVFQQLIQQRKIGFPIAYLVGEREFWSLPLTVTTDTLIPRPETELLVELALQQFPAEQSIRLVDLGTGSGAIALAIAHARPHWVVIATDRSEAALSVARQNANGLHISNVEFYLGNWYDALAAGERFHMIISNPPYICENDPHLQAELRFEPSEALVAGKDGLRDLMTIVAHAHEYLLANGCLLVEHGYDQADAVKHLFLQHHFVHISQWKDLSDITRVTSGMNI